jgi:hypothetical protein
VETRTLGDILREVEATLRQAWDNDGEGFEQADWAALYKQAIAIPCFRRGYSVAGTLRGRGDGRDLVADLPAFEKYRDYFAPKEQKLDLLAVDRAHLRMVLGAEIEWSGDRKTHKAEDDEVVRKIWGHAVPDEGYLAAILYDFGRLLAVNPPSMVLVTHPPPGQGPEPVVREVRAMYERASPEGRKGALLLMVDAETVSPRFFHFSPP